MVIRGPRTVRTRHRRELWRTGVLTGVTGCAKTGGGRAKGATMESQGRSRLGSTRTSGPSIQRIEFVRRLSSLPQNAPLVLVVAPPGYGKTTAVRQWTRTTRSPVVWLRMDQEHQDRQQLVRGLARGLLRAAPMEGLQQLAASPSDVPAEGAAG